MELGYKLATNESEAIERLNRAGKAVDKIKSATGKDAYVIDGVKYCECDLRNLANSLVPGNNFVRANC